MRFGDSDHDPTTSRKFSPQNVLLDVKMPERYSCTTITGLIWQKASQQLEMVIGLARYLFPFRSCVEISRVDRLVGLKPKVLASPPESKSCLYYRHTHSLTWGCHVVFRSILYTFPQKANLAYLTGLSSETTHSKIPGIHLKQ